MGICGTNNQIEQNKSTPKIQTDDSLVKPIPISYILNISKSICLIKVEFRNESKYGKGFLLKFWNNDIQDTFYCLMTNSHVITKDVIQNKDNVYICFDDQSKTRKIQLNEEERYIKNFIDIGLDIAVVEILDKDNISIDFFLEPLLDVNNITLINNNIIIIQYVKGNQLNSAKGKIKEINKYEFTHLANAEIGSGCPIFLENDKKVLGIHKACSRKKFENYGDFIYPVINLVKNDINIKKNKG